MGTIFDRVVPSWFLAGPRLISEWLLGGSGLDPVHVCQLLQGLAPSWFLQSPPRTATAMWAYWVVVFRLWRRWGSERHGTLEMAEAVAEQLTPDDGYHAGSVSIWRMSSTAARGGA